MCTKFIIPKRFSRPNNGLTLVVIAVPNTSIVPTKEVVSYASQQLSDSLKMHCRSNLKMPALILDEREKNASRFISCNGLVEDSCALEKERAMVNPWMPEEREIFMDKLAAFGKDFRRIASFLDHKTTADCVEFYYKNHKSECFKTKKRLESGNQGKSFSSNTYLVTSRKIWNREMNTASLDLLGDASLLAAQSEGKQLQQQVFSGMLSFGGCSNSRMSKGDCGVLEQNGSFNLLRSDREAVAADVLAGICGSISSEVMSSCITGSIDDQELNYEKADALAKCPFTPDVVENSENETCSGESCGDVVPSDWTDEERSTLIQAVSSYGKDFAMISRCVKTRSMDECKVFFSKARRCLGLDMMHARAGPTYSPANDDDDDNGVDSDIDDASALRIDSVVSSDKARPKMDEDLPASFVKREDDNISDPITALDLKNDVSHSEHDRVDVEEQVIGVDSVCNTSNVGPKLATGCVDPASQLAGPEETAVATSSLEQTSVRGDFQSLTSFSPSAVKELSLLKKVQMNINTESGTHFSVLDQDAVVDSSCNPVVGTTGGLGFSLNSNPEDKMLDIVETHPLVPSREEKAVTATCCEQIHTFGRVSSGGVDLLASAEKMEYIGSIRDIKRDGFCCRELSDSQSLAKPDGSLTAHYMPSSLNCFHQRCNNTDPYSSISGRPLTMQSSDQMNILPSTHVGSIAIADKPCRTDDFKLFGQIISSAQSHQKPNPSNLESNEKGPLQPNSTPLSSLNGDGSSALPNYHQNGYVGRGNIPLSCSGIWNGNREQKGFSTIPDSGHLLAKDPTTFSNYSLPPTATKVDPQPLRADTNKYSHYNLNGTSALFSPSELSNGNGVVDYQVFGAQENAGKLQPLTPEMMQRQDSYPDHPRWSDFEAISGLQQPGMGMIAMQVVAGGAGVTAGGPFNGVPDPVAAFKMHLAQSEQLGITGSSGTTSIIREDKSRRGKGNLGRQSSF